MRKLRIAHIDAGRGWSGGQVQSLGMAVGLAAKGHVTVFICRPGCTLERRARAAGLQVLAVKMRNQLDLGAVLRLRGLLQKLDPEVLMLHDSQSHSLGGLAGRWAGVPLILAFKRTDHPPQGGWRARQKYGKWVDRVVCVSEAARQAVLQAGLASERLVVLYESVDTTRFHPCPERREEARAALGYRPEHLLVVQVGEICKRKGQRILAEAAPRVLAAVPQARFLLCGTGTEEGEVRAMIKQLGLGHAFQLAGFCEDVRPCFAAGDLLAMPSLLEGLGVAVLEAMAMGLPVVASRTGGLQESVIDGDNGLLVTPGDPESLAQALIQALSNKGLRQALGRRGREQMEQHFSRKAMVDKAEALCFELLEGKQWPA